MPIINVYLCTIYSQGEQSCFKSCFKVVENMIRDRVPLEYILLVDLLASERSVLSDDSKELNKASFQNAAPFPVIQIKLARSSHFPA